MGSVVSSSLLHSGYILYIPGSSCIPLIPAHSQPCPKGSYCFSLETILIKTWVLGCLLRLRWHGCWMPQSTGPGGECVHSPMHMSRSFPPCSSEVPPSLSIATWTIPAPHSLSLTSVPGRRIPSSPSHGSALGHAREQQCG